jgi:hypothetical protein
MYDIIYNELVVAGIARPREVAVSLDRADDVCEKEDQYGELCELELTHPGYLLFADETGCNTSQKTDGHAAGTKYLVGSGQVPRTACSTTNPRFTVLPFTSGSGKPVLLVVMFHGKGEKVPADWKQGIDITITPERDNQEEPQIRIDKSNFGPGRYFPGGPSCTYNRKEIPMMAYMSESGGITAAILVNILATLDKQDDFPRVPGGPLPFLMIDGHSSRLDPIFLAYINNPAHVWKVCLGVPYATSYWQVGDSAEQNETFKILWYQVKDALVKWKSEKGMPMSIGSTDVVPLLNQIWEKAFGRVTSNLKATAKRGWNPLNRKLQSHPDILPDPNLPTAVSAISDNIVIVVSDNTTIIVSNNTAADVSKNTAVDVSKNTVINISDNTVTAVSDNTTTDVSKNTAIDILDNTATNISKNSVKRHIQKILPSSYP